MKIFLFQIMKKFSYFEMEKILPFCFSYDRKNLLRASLAQVQLYPQFLRTVSFAPMKFCDLHPRFCKLLGFTHPKEV